MSRTAPLAASWALLSLALAGCRTIGDDEIERGEPLIVIDRLIPESVPVSGNEPAASSAWVSWRGSRSDGRVRGISLPDLDPGSSWRERWRLEVGEGFSGAISDGELVFVHGRIDDLERVTALDAGTGREVWHREHEIRDWGQPFQAFGVTDGPLATPCLADGRLYTVGIHGRVQCLDAASGELLFSVRSEDFDDEPSELLYGHASSPLVHDGRLFVVFASSDRGRLVALDARSGALNWRSIDDPITYTSPQVRVVHGVEQLIVRSWRHVLGVDPADGEILWRHEAEAASDFQRDCASPLVVDDVVWLTNPFHGTIGLQLRPRGSDRLEPSRLFRSGALASITASPVLVDRHLYGLHRRGRLAAVDAYTGERAWVERAFDEHVSFLLFDRGRALALGNEGELRLLALAPDALHTLGTWQIGASTWAQPGVDARGLYVRDGAELIALDWPR